MLYIFSALYREARPVLERLSLKKIPENTCFQEFCDADKNIRLLITGVGTVAAAAAAGWMFAKYPPKERDIMLNIGSCAGKEPGAYLCYKLTKEGTEKSYYPDMFYCHPFSEGELLTVEKPVGKERVARGAKNLLYDMEGAALYQAGAHFLGPHQMQFIKIVSDSGVTEQIAPAQTDRCMERWQQTITDYILQLLRLTESMTDGEEERLSLEKYVKKLSAALCCSKTMEETLKVYLRYAQLSGKDPRCVEREFYEEGKLPCKDKREGKYCFEELKARLLF